MKSSVTITVEACLAAVEKAAANAIEGRCKIRSRHNLHCQSKDYVPPVAIMLKFCLWLSRYRNCSYSADGKLWYFVIDNAQIRVQFDAEGKLPIGTLKNEKELGPDYGLINASEIGKEWHEQ